MFSIVIAGEGEKEREGGGIFDLADEGVKAQDMWVDERDEQGRESGYVVDPSIAGVRPRKESYV